jgi:hypothetical protein
MNKQAELEADKDLLMTRCNLSDFFLYYNEFREEWLAIPRDKVAEFMNDASLPTSDKHVVSLIKRIEDGKAKH